MMVVTNIIGPAMMYMELVGMNQKMNAICIVKMIVIMMMETVERTMEFQQI